MNTHQKLLIAVALIVPGPAVQAQEVPTPGVSENVSEPEIGLDDLVARALRRNPQISIAREAANSARQNAAAYRGLANPNLLVTPGFSGTYNARNEEIVVGQPLDVFGQRRTQRRSFEARSRAASAGLTLAERQLVIAVKTAATELFTAQESESLASAQVEIARSFLSAAKRRAELGDVPAVQAQRAQLELTRAENELNNAIAERSARRATLNQLVGEQPDAQIRVRLPIDPAYASLLQTQRTAPAGPITPATVPTAGGVLLTAGNDITNAQRDQLRNLLSRRPDVLSAEAQLDAERANVTAIGKQRLPTFEIQARRDTVIQSGGTTSVRAMFSMPLMDFGSIKRSKKAAEADVRGQEAQVALLKSQASAQLETSLIRLKQRTATVELYRTQIVPQTFDLLRKTQVGYQQGASSYLEVLEAQRTARQIQSEYLQALSGVRLEAAALENSLGAALPVGFPVPLTSYLATPEPNSVGAKSPNKQ